MPVQISSRLGLLQAIRPQEHGSSPLRIETMKPAPLRHADGGMKNVNSFYTSAEQQNLRLVIFQDAADKYLTYTRAGGVTTFNAVDIPVHANMPAFTPGVPYVLDDLLFSFTASSSNARNVVDGVVTQDGFVGSMRFLSGSTNVLTIDFDNALSSAVTPRASPRVRMEMAIRRRPTFSISRGSSMAISRLASRA